MCGRFATTGDIDFYADYYAVDEVATESIDKSWNVAPTDETYVVAEHDGKRRLGKMAWGLIPYYSEDARTIHINARLESVADKPAFSRALTKNRCLIPADGFYEWEPKEKGRTPHWVYRADGHPMTFAGFWSSWRDPISDTWIRRFTIITTKAEGVIKNIHDRMPVALPEDVWDAWLDRDLNDVEEILSLIRPIDPDLIMEHPVSSRVNSVRNNGPDLVERFEESLF